MRKTESGYVVAITAISVMTFMILIGFAVDLGSWYLTATRLQRAADAASLAGAAALPDSEQAQTNIEDSLKNNGYVADSNAIHIATTMTGDRLVVQVKDADVKTYFTALFMPHLSITRQSTAIRANSAPALGSPFNVMGTGDLDIPGLPEKQNYWLAINGACDPKEDGDYFSAVTDRSKGPTTGTFNNHQAQYSGTPMHHCEGALLTGQINNADFEPSGYSYYVDIPKPATPTDVDIKVYDPSFYDVTGGQPTNDKSMFLAGDTWAYPAFNFSAWNTNNTPDDATDDTKVAYMGALADDDQTVTFKEWVNLYTVPYSSIPSDGAQYRVQVEAYTGTLDYLHLRVQSGVNAFSIGAFPGGAIAACDTRTDAYCPRVYGRKAVSVYNNLLGGTGSTSDFYFAEIDTSYTGRTLQVKLWDPGEGVAKMQLLGPDNTPLKFDWATSDGDYSGTNVDTIDTSGTGPPAGPNLSNDYKFNDRLITVQLTVPSNYAEMVAASNQSKWLKIRYTVGTTNSDRTTWGIAINSSPSAPPRLTRN